MIKATKQCLTPSGAKTCCTDFKITSLLKTTELHLFELEYFYFLNINFLLSSNTVLFNFLKF